MNLHSIESRSQGEVAMEGASRVKMRMLIGPDQGAPNFHMRHFEIAPGGHTPLHEHDYEHEVLILEGEGIVTYGQGQRHFKAGDVIFMPANEKHQFACTGTSPCAFICLIPAPKDCSI